MKIKASFDSIEKAEYVSSCINENFPQVYSDITTLYDTSGYYSYCTVVPNMTANTICLSGIFCPVFPENATSNDVNKVARALLEIKCSPENSEELGRFILDCGGRIEQ